MATSQSLTQQTIALIPTPAPPFPAAEDIAAASLEKSANYHI